MGGFLFLKDILGQEAGIEVGRELTESTGRESIMTLDKTKESVVVVSKEWSRRERKHIFMDYCIEREKY